MGSFSATQESALCLSQLRVCALSLVGIHGVDGWAHLRSWWGAQLRGLLGCSIPFCCSRSSPVDIAGVGSTSPAPGPPRLPPCPRGWVDRQARSESGAEPRGSHPSLPGHCPGWACGVRTACPLQLGLLGETCGQHLTPRPQQRAPCAASKTWGHRCNRCKPREREREGPLQPCFVLRPLHEL